MQILHSISAKRARDARNRSIIKVTVLLAAVDAAIIVSGCFFESGCRSHSAVLAASSQQPYTSPTVRSRAGGGADAKVTNRAADSRLHGGYSRAGMGINRASAFGKQVASTQAGGQNLYGKSFYSGSSSGERTRPITSIQNPLHPMDGVMRERANQYGGSFYGGMNSGISSSTINGMNNGMNAPMSTVNGMNTGLNAPMNLGTTHAGIGPGITGFGGAGLGGSSATGRPASISTNGIGAPASRAVNMITPYGNGANGPIGTYGGSSFGSSAGGSVR